MITSPFPSVGAPMVVCYSTCLVPVFGKFVSAIVGEQSDMLCYMLCKCNLTGYGTSLVTCPMFVVYSLGFYVGIKLFGFCLKFCEFWVSNIDLDFFSLWLAAMVLSLSPLKASTKQL